MGRVAGNNRQETQELTKRLICHPQYGMIHVVGRATFVMPADEEIWRIDPEAESWDFDVEAVFPHAKIET